MPFPDKALPDWIKDFQCENWTDICRAKDALRIAWEHMANIDAVTTGLTAYDWINARNKAAMDRIRALGDK